MRKCWLAAFSPFLIMFSKTFFFSAVWMRICVIKHLNLDLCGSKILLIGFHFDSVLLLILRNACLDLLTSLLWFHYFTSLRSFWLQQDKVRKLKFNPFPNKPWFLRVCFKSLLKTLWEKEKLLATSNFSFSHCVFYLLGEVSTIFNKFEIVVCKLFWFGRV